MLMLMEEFIASQFIYFFSQVTPIRILINYLFKISAQYLITGKKRAARDVSSSTKMFPSLKPAARPAGLKQSKAFFATYNASSFHNSRVHKSSFNAYIIIIIKNHVASR